VSKLHTYPKLRQYRSFSYLDFQKYSIKFQVEETETDRELLEIDKVLGATNVPGIRALFPL
jgi:hypothetical protein